VNGFVMRITKEYILLVQVTLEHKMVKQIIKLNTMEDKKW